MRAGPIADSVFRLSKMSGTGSPINGLTQTRPYVGKGRLFMNFDSSSQREDESSGIGSPSPYACPPMEPFVTNPLPAIEPRDNSCKIDMEGNEVTELEWVFDPVPPSGALSGGDPKSYLFSPNIDSLVREVVQNSTDQQVGNDPVKVSFTLHELTDASREAFLDAVEWPRLEQHLNGVAESQSLINGRVREALDDIATGRLLLLHIEDSGTRGLTGPEDGTNGNFAALCKHVLVTNDEKAARGGSYGLGKAVLWRFSALETVLFGSQFENEPGNLDERVFGRTELPYHDAEGKEWAGSGWFGVPQSTDVGRRAVSARGTSTAALQRDLMLERSQDTGTGTTALIVGFSEPAAEQPRPVTDVVNEIAHSAARWFWPRIAENQLIIEARGFVGGDLVVEKTATAGMADFGYVAAAYADATGDVAKDVGALAERELELRIPRVKADPQHGEIEGSVRLRLYRVEDDDSADASAVALVRGAGMVVRHHRVSGVPLQGGGYRAVLVAGGRHGAEESDADIEEFLRAAEPPEHDQWVHHTNALRSRYRPGAKARLDELWSKIRLAVIEMTSSKPGGSEDGPALLMKYFQLGGRRGSKFKPTGSSLSSVARSSTALVG